MWFIVGCIFSIFTISGLYSQSYKVRLNNTYNEQNFFRAEKSIELKKPSNDEYLSNQFYVKSGDNFSIPEIEKNIKIILSNSGYSNIIINKIEKPFQKYINSEMLKKQSSRLENIFKITIENDYEIFDLCSLLSDNSGIIYATPVINYRFADFIPNDNHIDKLWWLENSDFFKSWDIAKGDKTITIGIIDSGCDYLHEDLNSQVKINTLEIPDDNIDNDGNGFIDDTHGWDFVGDISHFDAITGKFIEDNNVIPKYQSNDHGTHVTGIAAAKTNNTTGISSSGFDVMFLPVKIGVDDLSKSRLVYRPYEALLYAAMMGVDIINCSWASSFHDPLAVDVINEVLNKGVVIVAASGNETFWIDNFPYYPAALPGVIAVGSINQNNTRSLFSNYGVRVSCYAPGEGIYSTLNNNRYGNKSGTSMASPLVAGFIASVKKAFPHFTNQQILQQIRSTTSQMLPQSILLHGKLNAFDAVRYNNINFQSFVSPGISFEDVLIENSNVVDKIGTTKIRVKLKNHLSDASNIVVTFSPQDNFFDISRNNFQINSFPSNTSQSLEFDLNLSENCPWFDGNLLFVAEYKADDYYNVELIEIPVKLETSNKSLLVQSFDDNLDIDWYSSDVADKFDFWSVGYDNTNKRGVVYNFGKLNNLFSPSKDTVIDVSAIDSRNLFIAVNGKDGYNAILKSENSGASFTSNSISDLLSSIDNIYFYDLTNGILTGRNEQNIAEILYTENGLNYKKSSVNYTFSNIENEYISTNINARKSNLFVATSYGRILKSMDKGKNWSKISDWFNDKITDIAAINDDSIFVIVNLNSENKLQFSTNGGARFSNIPAVNIDLNNIIKMFVPDSSNTLYLLSKEGKLYFSSDYGKIWNSELNKQYNFGDFSKASLYSENGNGRLWLAGLDINYLDFTIIPENIIKDVKIAGNNYIKFDTVNINEFKEDIIFLENKGNYKSKILSQVLTSKDHFSISDNFKQNLTAGELISATIRYNPESEGIHYDTLEISTNASDDKLIYYLEGISVNPNSIKDVDNDNNFSLLLSDNNLITLDIKYHLPDVFKIHIYDLNGNIIKDLGSHNHNGNHSIYNFSSDDFPSGIYYMSIQGKDVNISLKMLLTK